MNRSARAGVHTGMNRIELSKAVGCVIVGAGLVAAVTACSDDTDSAVNQPSVATSTPPAAIPQSVPVTATHVADLGSVVVDVDGMVVYTLSLDTADASACMGKCAENWPIVEAPDPFPASVAGISGSLGVLIRPDGQRQLVLSGHPLYTFVKDTAPGQYNGRGKKLGDASWGVMLASGTPLY